MPEIWKNLNWKFIPFVFFTFFLLIYVIFELSGFLTLEDAKTWALSSGPLASLVIVLLLVIDLIIPVPSSVLMTLAGSLYGFFWGTMIGTLGSLLASITGFYLTRYLGKHKALLFIDQKEQQSMNKWFTQWGGRNFDTLAYGTNAYRNHVMFCRFNWYFICAFSWHYYNPLSRYPCISPILAVDYKTFQNGQFHSQ